jgi:hypothetical protein
VVVCFFFFGGNNIEQTPMLRDSLDGFKNMATYVFLSFN